MGNNKIKIFKKNNKHCINILEENKTSRSNLDDF